MSEEPIPPRKARIPRTPMPVQDPGERRFNFREVALGYSEEQAVLEASRCIQCKNPTCIQGCPVSIDIPGFIKLVGARDFRGAIRKMKEANILPAVCGRVCPQETQCEAQCIMGRKYEPLAIGRLERFVADWERSGGEIEIPIVEKPTGRRVAIVGSGPAGLAAAADLARLGHHVEIFEALHKPGGVLIYGIPEFRLPKSIVDAEVHTLERMGVRLHMNHVIGRTETVDELQERFDAVFICTGAGLPWFLGIPGEDLIGVYSANEYLTRSNLMKAYDFPIFDTPTLAGRHVATIGGGNVAMDASRTALRLGAERSYLVYRRSAVEMPARAEEIEHAREEGVDLLFLTSPVRLLGDDRGRVSGMELQAMELGAPDASGRRRPVPIAGSSTTLDVDTVIVAIGNGPNPLVPQTTPDIQTRDGGNVVVDPRTLMTTKEGVFAGGDIVLGAATVILAMGQGRQAARSIDEYFHTGDPHELAGELRRALDGYLKRYPAMKQKSIRAALRELAGSVDASTPPGSGGDA